MERKGKNIPFDGKIHFTTNLEIFKFAPWNRNVDKARVKKVKLSIEDVGYIPSPIIVNEKMEIIDGQARVTALKEIDMRFPVYYIVVPGLNGRECKSMNASMTNWKTKDFVHLYASNGNQTYVLLYDIMNKYPKLSDSIIITAIAGTSCGGIMDKVKREQLSLTKKDLDTLDKRLDYLMQFSEVYLRCGRKDILQKSLLIAFEEPTFQKEHMVKKLNETMNVGKYGNIDECLDFLSTVYNKNRRDGKIDFIHFYHYEFQAYDVWKKGE